MSVLRVMSSKASPSALAVVCIIAVKKDIGLKRPEIHKEFGAVISSEYSVSWLILSRRSSNQVKRSLSEK